LTELPREDEPKLPTKLLYDDGDDDKSLPPPAARADASDPAAPAAAPTAR
jgi:hypothetical protein